MFEKLPVARALVLLLGGHFLVYLQAGDALAGPFDDPGHDPLNMIAWADSVESFLPGPIEIDVPGSPPASFGAPGLALMSATGDSFDVVSLGDGGSLTLGFTGGIGNGLGDDFAIWENGFVSIGGLFAELAFVEVSSNGVDFVRFPTTTLNPFPVLAFDTLDPTDYDGLAGDQAIDLGTGFDLFALIDDPLVASRAVDLDDIRFVRIIDVIGDGSTTDDVGQPIYDPFPTPFSSGGFDVEAVGVIHEAPEPALTTGLLVGVLLLLSARSRRYGTTLPPCAG